LIIFVVLFVFAAVGFVLVAIELTEARRQINAGFLPTGRDASVVKEIDGVNGKGLMRALQDEKQRVREKEDLLLAFVDRTGVSHTSDIPASKLDDTMAALRTRVKETLDGKGEVTVASATLVDLLALVEKEKLSLEDKVRDAVAEREKRETELQMRVDGLEKDLAQQEEIVKDRAGEITKLNDTLAEDRALHRQEVAAFKRTIAEQQKTAEDNEAVRLERIRILEAEVADLRARLARYQQERGGTAAARETFDPANEPADGKVILVTRDSGIMINIGTKEGVRRGLRFDVYLPKGDGTRLKRGEIEIKTVRDDISRGILVGGGDPTEVVYVNDIITNVAFDPGRAKVFVADDVFDDAKKQAFREALAEHGSVLEDEVTVRTDYLIVGAQEGNFVKRARELKVVEIPEGELNRFLDR